MLTRIPAETLDGMGVRFFADIDDLLREADFNDKDVYVMPYGGYTVSYLKDAKTTEN
ncbi:hypothetical protein [Desulfosporosinus orientis]|uniref:hypothetical protein n=1 Tax=Desulfosporosinus orientis TaxID=1563 RepID=UPI0013052462|nr:hypothetical protein [Desulfosporosinus orientis]